MQLSRRSKLSLCQMLERANQTALAILVEKHGIENHWLSGNHSKLTALKDALVATATDQQFNAIVDEILRTKSVWVNEWEEDDERWQDFLRCIELDGYRVEGQGLIATEPTISEAAPVEDDLRTELKNSNLPKAEEVAGLIESSALEYKKTDLNFNGCLTTARSALQTLVTDMAVVRRDAIGGSFNESKWGQVLAYLRTSDLITKEEEEAIAGVFTFVSPGAHVLVGLDERDMARLGRSLVGHMCYFLIRKHKG